MKVLHVAMYPLYFPAEWTMCSRKVRVEAALCFSVISDRYSWVHSMQFYKVLQVLQGARSAQYWTSLYRTKLGIIKKSSDRISGICDMHYCAFKQ